MDDELYLPVQSNADIRHIILMTSKLYKLNICVRQLGKLYFPIHHIHTHVGNFSLVRKKNKANRTN